MVAPFREPHTEPPANECGITVLAHLSRGEWVYSWSAIAPNFRGEGLGNVALEPGEPATAEGAALAGVLNAIRTARQAPAVLRGTRFTVLVSGSAAAVAILNDPTQPAPRFASVVADLRDEITLLGGNVQFHIQPGTEGTP